MRMGGTLQPLWGELRVLYRGHIPGDACAAVRGPELKPRAQQSRPCSRCCPISGFGLIAS
eukprot:14973687-Alexandrium_andersonii.AAC.1